MPSLSKFVKKQPAAVACYLLFIAAAVCTVFGFLPGILGPAMPWIFTAAAVIAFASTFRPTAQSIATVLGITAFVFALQALNVETSFPFGNLVFTHALGFRLLKVPLAAPCLWIGIIAASFAFTKYIMKSEQILIAAMLTVAIDIPFERAAEMVGYWHFGGSHAPIQNYLTWFLVSLFSLALLVKTSKKISRPALGAHLYIALALFILLTYAGMRLIEPSAG